MNSFPLPAEPTPKQSAFEGTLVRCLLVFLPVVLVGHLLGVLAIAAVLISSNYNILGWIE